MSAPDEQLIQVLDAAGGLVDAMANVADCPAGRDPATRRGGEIRSGLDEEAFLVVGVGAATPDGARTVVVVRTLPDPADCTMLLVDLLEVGMPVLQPSSAGRRGEGRAGRSPPCPAKVDVISGE